MDKKADLTTSLMCFNKKGSMYQILDLLRNQPLRFGMDDESVLALTKEVVSYAKRHVGAGYYWGAYGQKMTEQFLQQQVKRFGADKVKPDIQRKKIWENLYLIVQV